VCPGCGRRRAGAETRRHLWVCTECGLQTFRVRGQAPPTAHAVWLVGRGLPVTRPHGPDRPQRDRHPATPQPAVAAGSRMPAVKNVGEPCAGEPHARFDGGREETNVSRPRRATPGASRLPDQPRPTCTPAIPTGQRARVRRRESTPAPRASRCTRGQGDSSTSSERAADAGSADSLDFAPPVA
jgi:hypothetical protein